MKTPSPFQLLAIAAIAALPLHAAHRLLIAESGRQIAIVAADGTVEWSYPVKGALHDVQLLDNGNILCQLGYQRIVEITPEKEIAWEYNAATANGNAGKRIEVHSFRRLADGTTMIAESGNGRIIEVDHDGKIQREFKLKVNNPHPHTDTRLVHKLANGNYLVSHEGDGTVREYDGKGEVVWEFEVPMFDKPAKGGHGPEAWGNKTFSSIRLKNGNTLVSTGNGHGVLEVTPDKQIVWSLQQNDLPGIVLAWVTTLEELPNGNYLIGNCHAGDQNPQMIEVDKAKKVIWAFKDSTNFGNNVANWQVID